MAANPKLAAQHASYLYKQLVDEAGFDSPNVSVIPFDDAQALAALESLAGRP